jgi:hypothetical protein
MSGKKRTSRASGDALYVYCIGEASGIEKVFAGNLPEPIEPEGAFERVTVDGVSVVASRVPLSDYGEDVIESRLSDPGWTAERAMRHAAVLERLASRAAIVPLRLGTIFLGAPGIEAMLRERYAELQDLLGRLGGRDEWSVIVYCDRNALKEGIDAQSAKLRELSAQAASASKGRGYLLARKMDALRAQESRAWIRRALSDMEKVLESSSEEVRPIRAAGRGPDPDGAEARLTCLVPRDGFAEFRAAAEDLAARHRGMGFRLELVGPLPVYSFIR